MKKIILLLLGIFLLISFTSADNLYQYRLNATSYNGGNNINAVYTPWGAENFWVSNGNNTNFNLTYINLYSYWFAGYSGILFSSPTYDLHVSLRSYNLTTGHPNNIDLSTGSVSTEGNSSNWTRVNMTPYTILANTSYFLVFHTNYYIHWIDGTPFSNGWILGGNRLPVYYSEFSNESSFTSPNGYDELSSPCNDYYHCWTHNYFGYVPFQIYGLNGSGGITCGDLICSVTENYTTCPTDCPITTCGNGLCDLIENNNNCPYDCPLVSCGNGFCDGSENINSCPFDCTQADTGSYTMNISQNIVNVSNINQGLLPDVYYGLTTFFSNNFLVFFIFFALIFIVLVILAVAYQIKNIITKI